MKIGSKLILIVLLVAVGLYAALMTMRALRAEKYVGILHRSMRATAVTLHSEHFNNDPSSLHIMWWSTLNSPVAGLIVHTQYLDPVSGGVETIWAEDGAGLRVLQNDYNYITLGQACHLALHGEYSPRIRAILEVAKQSYRGSTEAELLEALDKLKTGDQDAISKYEQVLKWSSESYRPNRRYFQEVLMPQAAKWANESTDSNHGLESTSAPPAAGTLETHP